MRHRMGIAGMTGLGNPLPVILQNNTTKKIEGKLKKFVDEAINLYFKRWDGCDYSINDEEILLGVEPAYQYDYLRLIALKKDKKNSYIKNGRAWGDWGSEITLTTKFYSDYKNKCKFIKFIDKWHSVLYA